MTFVIRAATKLGELLAVLLLIVLMVGVVLVALVVTAGLGWVLWLK